MFISGRPSRSKTDFAATARRVVDQFRGLDVDDPAMWPPLPRHVLCATVMTVVLAGLWFLWLRDMHDTLEAARAREVALRADYQKKVEQAAHLASLKQQRDQVRQFVALLEKQLPGKAEMDALLSDINQAGLNRHLQFELFRPGQTLVQAHYAELPIAVRVTGRYHDMGAFVAEVAHLLRIVTLHNLAIAPQKDGLLAMEATVRTFRHLDLEEQAAQKRVQTKDKK